jgi:chloramphenicol-sensitive protein RarD
LGVIVLAVERSLVLQASLGYFINPLVSVLLAVLVLREQLRTLQWCAVALAGVAVGYQVVQAGTLPWIAVTLALSFAVYSLIRKQVPVDALTGLFAETALVAPVSAIFLLVLAVEGAGAFGAIDWHTDVMLMLAGPVTALPLLLFAVGARRINLTSLGLLQYIAPTGHLLLAVLAFAEPLRRHDVVTFALIWIALALYSADTVWHRSRG